MFVIKQNESRLKQYPFKLTLTIFILTLNCWPHTEIIKRKKRMLEIFFFGFVAITKDMNLKVLLIKKVSRESFQHKINLQCERNGQLLTLIMMDLFPADTNIAEACNRPFGEHALVVAGYEFEVPFEVVYDRFVVWVLLPCPMDRQNSNAQVEVFVPMALSLELMEDLNL